jgi:predicted N-formylglutamate amidohydrolase
VAGCIDGPRPSPRRGSATITLRARLGIGARLLYIARDMTDLRLLADDEPAPFIEERRGGRSSFVIVVDHAGNRIPRCLGALGLPPAELERHIAWDIGSLGLARRLAAALDAVLVAQPYSRLVIDCNRDPRVPSSIAESSEYVAVPGNLGLSGAAREARRAQIFAPYHERIRSILDERAAAGRRTILLAQHTMTDVFKGVRRAMHGAVLYNRDRRFAGLVLDALRAERELNFADNEPYFLSDDTDYTIPQHGEARHLPHVEIEVRQDLVRDTAGQAAWAARLARALEQAEHAFLGGAA